MLKNRKILMFMMLNSMIGITAPGSKNEVNKFENIYNQIIKNLNENTSNSNNYKILEKILNQRNKELKDLYLQNDYIIKPEYLSFQVFFSGFYSDKDRKGTKKTEKIPKAPTSSTIDISISMPDILVNDPEINIENISAGVPEININKNTVVIPDINYSNSIEVPEFVIPVLPVVTVTPPTFTVSTNSLFSPSTMYDKTFYNPALSAVQTWNTGLFSNYNLESGNFTYTGKVASSGNATTYSFNNAVGSIDPAAIIDATLNQPSVIPVSASNAVNFTGIPMLVSTSAPNIRIGQNAVINLSSSNTLNNYQSTILMLQYTLSPNRSTLNADTDYAFGGSKAYPDSQADIPFSIMRNSGTVNMSGNYAVAGLLMIRNNQNGNRNDYLLINDGTITGEYNGPADSQHVGLAFEGLASPGTKGERYVIGNDGKMEFRAPRSTAFNLGGVNLGKYQIVYNRGTVNLYGSNSFGVSMAYSSLS